MALTFGLQQRQPFPNVRRSVDNAPPIRKQFTVDDSYLQELRMSHIERSSEFEFRLTASDVAGTLNCACSGRDDIDRICNYCSICRQPLARLDSFIPSIQFIVSITGIITAVLLFGQFWTIGSRGVLVLAGGYLFVALIVVSHILTFPGAFSPTGLLGAGAQTAGWLYFLWHFGFPVAVIGYALLKDAEPSKQFWHGSVGAEIALSVGGSRIGLFLT